MLAWGNWAPKISHHCRPLSPNIFASSNKLLICDAISPEARRIFIFFSSIGEEYKLELGGPLFVGGLASALASEGQQRQDGDGQVLAGNLNENFRRISPVLWTSTLRKGYMGCLRDLVVNGQNIDVAEFAKRQNSGLYSHWKFLYLKVPISKMGLIFRLAFCEV